MKGETLRKVYELVDSVKELESGLKKQEFYTFDYFRSIAELLVKVHEV